MTEPKLTLVPEDDIENDPMFADPEPQPVVNPFLFKNDDRLAMPALDKLLRTPPRSIEQVCQRWIWVTAIKRFIDRTDCELWDKEQFDSQFNPFLGNSRANSISKELFREGQLLRKFKKAAFIPGRPEFVGNVYNTWRPSPVVPIKGDTSVWDAHLTYLFPNERDRNLLLDWLAWVYQNPSKRPLYALLIVGKQTGTGKSFVARVMEQLVGPENTRRPKNSSLKGQFNSWVWKSRLILIEELHAIGKREVANELRDVITEARLEINIKHVPQFTADLHIAVMSISNHPDALPIDKTDRRWLIVNSPVTAEQKRKAYDDGHFDRFIPLIDENGVDLRGLGHIAYQLSKRDVRHFRPGDAPMTAGKQEMIELSDNSLQTWLRENQHNDPLSRTLVNIRNDILPAIPNDIAKPYGSNVETAVRKFIKDELDAMALGDVKIDRRNINLWALNGLGAEAGVRGVAKFKAHYNVAAMYKTQTREARLVEEAQRLEQARRAFAEPWDGDQG